MMVNQDSSDKIINENIQHTSKDESLEKAVTDTQNKLEKALVMDTQPSNNVVEEDKVEESVPKKPIIRYTHKEIMDLKNSRYSASRLLNILSAIRNIEEDDKVKLLPQRGGFKSDRRSFKPDRGGGYKETGGFRERHFYSHQGNFDNSSGNFYRGRGRDTNYRGRGRAMHSDRRKDDRFNRHFNNFDSKPQQEDTEAIPDWAVEKLSNPFNFQFDKQLDREGDAAIIQKSKEEAERRQKKYSEDDFFETRLEAPPGFSHDSSAQESIDPMAIPIADRHGSARQNTVDDLVARQKSMKQQPVSISDLFKTH